MKHRLVFNSLPLLALFLALSPTVRASTTWYVDGVHGNDNNDCKSPQTACKTIGHNISLSASGDSIMVAAATYKEHLTIGFSLTIVGAGASTTILDGSHRRGLIVVSIPHANAQVTLSKLTIQNGGNSGFHGHSPDGGGIYSLGTLTIDHSTIRGNAAGIGGGVFNDAGTVTINDSTVSGNVAKNVGAIENRRGTVTINNSTISRNSATAVFGGIANQQGTMTMNNSTITGNSRNAVLNGGTMTINNSTLSGNSAEHGVGGNLVAAGETILQNTLIANSQSDGNCYGNITSNGYNLSSDNTCNFNGTGDLNNTDPKLGQLGNYGGPTQTIPLLSGSPAIDSGNPGGCTDGQGQLLRTDQRGKPRHDKEDSGGCDMGAYERQKD
jgi:hypothetical protein